MSMDLEGLKLKAELDAVKGWQPPPWEKMHTARTPGPPGPWPRARLDVPLTQPGPAFRPPRPPQCDHLNTKHPASGRGVRGRGG